MTSPPLRIPPTERCALWSARNPKTAICGWILFVVLCYCLGSAAGMRDATDTQLGAGESGRATAMIAEAHFPNSTTEEIVITARTNAKLDPALAQTAAAHISAGLADLQQVSKVSAPVPSANAQALLLTVTVVDGVTDPQPLLDVTSKLARNYPNLTIGETGDLSINADVNNALGRDFHKALLISLPITLLILLIAFGALIAAGIPVLLGLSSVLSAVGLYTAASHLFPDGGTTAELILLIGMAVGVDYSLFYLKREREERAAGKPAEVALRIAARTAGHAVVTSGIAVTVAFAGLYLIGDANFTAMATGAVLVVLLAIVGSLSVLPAVLSMLGERVDRPRIPVFWRISNSGRPSRLWPTMLRPALRYPAATLILALAGMLLLAYPAMNLHLKQTGASDLPRTMTSMQTYDRLQSAFPDQRGSYSIVVQGTNADQAVSAIVASAAAHQGFLPGPTVMSVGETSVITLATSYTDDSPEAQSLVGELRSAVIPPAISSMNGIEVAVGGDIASGVDYKARMASRAPWVASFVLLLTFILMAMAFRSVAIGIVTIFANLLSTGAAFGVLVLVFQHNWAAGWLGFHPSGAVIAWIPAFLFVILFGLSMDYHVLVVSRIREGIDHGLSTRDAVKHGVASSAGVVTSAAAVMIGVFAIFAGLSLVEFKELGIGLAVSIFLDAVVVRILILPSLMILLGNANWWAPRFMARRSGVESTQEFASAG